LAGQRWEKPGVNRKRGRMQRGPKLRKSKSHWLGWGGSHEMVDQETIQQNLGAPKEKRTYVRAERRIKTWDIDYRTKLKR